MSRSGERTPGRGATTNPTGRFEGYQRAAFDDGWGDLPADAARARTEVTPERSRSAISRNRSPDIPFDRSINPYKGCEHGCAYCYARPTHAYLGLSPGLDFETRITSRPDVPGLLRGELARPGYRCAPIALGTNTDPYQPAERRLGITRAILELLAEHRHPFTIVTKSNLVLRDLDIIAPMAARGMATVAISVTTLSRDLARRMEPRAPTPGRRVQAMAALARAGVPTGAMVAPVVPGLTDGEIEAIVAAAAGAGARWCGHVLLRLPGEVQAIFAAWLEAAFPDRAARVLSLVRQCRGGDLDQPAFGLRMRGSGPYARLIDRRVLLARRRHGLDDAPPVLDTGRFRPPPRDGQLPLFG